MKALLKSLVVATATLLAIPSIAPQAEAAKIRLDGSGYYQLGTKIQFRPAGAKQTGRYRNLGGDYYHTCQIGMDWITNRSNNSTGPLSFELWAMPYYGANKGIVLFTRSLKKLRGGGYYTNPSRKGRAIFLDRRRFPEINIWEKKTWGRRNWKFRDALSFRRKDLL